MSTQQRWKTKDRDIRYDNPWISVEHRNVIAPTGVEGIYGCVHFKNLAIGIVPIDQHGYTWLVGQHRYMLDVYTWEIPEGGGSLASDPLETAKRELREETGITANRWTPLLNLNTSNSVTDECAHTFVAQELSVGDVEPDETEVLTIKRLPLREAVDMAMAGEITDSLAMASLFKVQLLMDRGELTL